MLAGLGMLLAAYLLLALGVPPDRPARDETGCYDRVVYQTARLSDC